MSLGPWQIVLIVVLLLIFFGPKRIPALGKSLGEAIRGFQRGLNGKGGDEKEKDNTQLSSETHAPHNSDSRRKHEPNKDNNEA